jgi:hypothetical protein
MTSNDSGGKRLAAALTETRFGACNINLEMKQAALIPPRFLLQREGEGREREEEEEEEEEASEEQTNIPNIYYAADLVST